MSDFIGELVEVVQLGVQMREAQAAYFRTLTIEALLNSRAIERAFDLKAKAALAKARGEAVQDVPL